MFLFWLVKECHKSNFKQALWTNHLLSGNWYNQRFFIIYWEVEKLRIGAGRGGGHIFVTHIEEKGIGWGRKGGGGKKGKKSSISLFQSKS